MMAFLFFEAPSSDVVKLNLEVIMKGNEFQQTQNKRKRVNAQQSNVAYNKEQTHAAFFTLAPYDDVFFRRAEYSAAVRTRKVRQSP